jgi:hypothetical protein
MEIKQHIPEQPVRERRNQKGKLKKSFETNTNGDSTY